MRGMVPFFGLIAVASFALPICLGTAWSAVTDIRRGTVNTSRGPYTRWESPRMFWALNLAVLAVSTVFGVIAISSISKLISMGLPT